MSWLPWADLPPSSLLMDFAQLQTAWVRGPGDVTLRPRLLSSYWNFTRASAATRINAAGLIESVGNNVARIDHDPVTLQPRGLLVEGQRTNLLLRSEGFTAAPWVAAVIGTSTRVNDGAPLGFTLALVTATSANGGIRQVLTGLVSGQVYTLSFYIESTAASVTIVFENGTAAFGSPHNVTINPSNGTAGVLTGFTSVRIEPFGPGFIYTLITAPAGGLLTANIEWRITNSGQSIRLGRPQLEAGAFASSYIPTGASQVTRVADVATVTGANFSDWYNQAEGTVLVDFRFSGATGDRAAVALFGAGGEYIAVNTAAGFNSRIQSAGALQHNVAFPIFADADQRVAIGYRVNDAAASMNGSAANTDNTVAIPVGIDRLAIGSFNGVGISSLFGTIRRIRYWPIRLTNAQLQTITGPYPVTVLDAASAGTLPLAGSASTVAIAAALASGDLAFSGSAQADVILVASAQGAIPLDVEAEATSIMIASAAGDLPLDGESDAEVFLLPDPLIVFTVEAESRAFAVTR